MYKRKKIPNNRPSKGNLGLTELSNCKQPTTKCCNRGTNQTGQVVCKGKKYFCILYCL